MIHLGIIGLMVFPLIISHSGPIQLDCHFQPGVWNDRSNANNVEQKRQQHLLGRCNSSTSTVMASLLAGVDEKKVGELLWHIERCQRHLVDRLDGYVKRGILKGKEENLSK